MGSQVKEPMKRVMQTHNACEMCGIVCEILDFVCDNAHIKPDLWEYWLECVIGCIGKLYFSFSLC